MVQWWPVIKVVFGILFIAVCYDDYLTYLKGVEKFEREMQAEKDFRELKAEQKKNKVEILEEIKNPIEELIIELANNVSKKDQTL
jgi:large-conductance mechanosensitive channel